jgi:MFS family permease
MARPKWLAILTQHGEKPPAMLKSRSSDGFIIGTVALAVFTVSTPKKKLFFLVELQRMIA